MKIISFNINSLRARLHQLEALIQKHSPDVIGLQETKVHDDEFPLDAIRELGYQVVYHGQKGHYGVATLSLATPIAVEKGFPGEDADAQRRLVVTTFDAPGKPVKIVNGYFPQGESREHPVKFPAKAKFYRDLIDYLNAESGDYRLIVMGDINISPTDLDIGIGEDNRKRWLRTGKCSFLPEEREWLGEVLGTGLHDTFRTRHPEVSDRFSWFDYRSRGFDREPRRGLRIDTILADEELNGRLVDCGIDYDIRAMERPSDHCPVWSEFDLK